jgi:hypothetical protein
MTAAQAGRSLRLYAEKVLPRLAHLRVREAVLAE